MHTSLFIDEILRKYLCIIGICWLLQNQSIFSILRCIVCESVESQCYAVHCFVLYCSAVLSFFYCIVLLFHTVLYLISVALNLFRCFSLCNNLVFCFDVFTVGLLYCIWV